MSKQGKVPDFQTSKDQICFVAIDVETATHNGGICQIGIVTVEGGIIIDEKQYMVRPPENKYDPENMYIHGITPDMTKNELSIAEIWPELETSLNGKCVIGHNISFDLNTLDKDAETYSLDKIHPAGTQCTSLIHQQATLKDVCAHYGINLSNHHNALSDARASALVFLKYLEAKTYRPRVKKSPNKTTPWDNLHIKSETLVPDLHNCINSDTIFYNKKTVITGIFEKYPEREELASILKSYGADINTSISKKTEIVVIGSGAGPKKLEKIEEINASGQGNIRTINEDELYSLLSKYKGNPTGLSDTFVEITIY